MDTWIIPLFIAIILSGFFSGTKMAFATANTLRIENQKDDGDRKAAVAMFIIERFSLAEGALTLANISVKIVAGALITTITAIEFGLSYLWLTTIIIVAITIVFGETIPKYVAQKNASRISVATAYIVFVIMIIGSPIIIITNLICKIFRGKSRDTDEDITEEQAELELQAIIETVEDEGIIDEGRSELLQAALDFSSIAAVEVMTARVDILAIDIGDDMEKIEEIIYASPHSRLPIYEDNIDNIIGVLYLNHYFKADLDKNEISLRDMMIEPCYAYKTMKLPAILGELKRKKTHIAVVTDEYGGSMGIITMEDILEELVGEIWDETDEIEPEVVETEQGVYELEGDVSIGEFVELGELDEDEFKTDSATIGGWCMEKLGRFAVVGDSFTHENLVITVTGVDGLRIDSVKVKILDR